MILLVDIYVVCGFVNTSCQRSLLILCSIKIRQVNGKMTILNVTVAYDNIVHCLRFIYYEGHSSINDNDWIKLSS